MGDVENPSCIALAFESEQEAVTKAVVTAETWFKSKSENDDLLSNLSIVLAEALNNIVEHAYEYREDGQIRANLAFKEGSIIIDLCDDGKKMPGLPVKREMDGHTKDLEDLPEGGFGWFLIHTLVAGMDYKYEDNSNHLTLTLN